MHVVRTIKQPLRVVEEALKHKPGIDTGSKLMYFFTAQY